MWLAGPDVTLQSPSEPATHVPLGARYPEGARGDPPGFRTGSGSQGSRSASHVAALPGQERRDAEQVMDFTKSMQTYG